MEELKSTLEVIGPVGAACMLIIWGLSKWFLPALKNSRATESGACPMPNDFSRHTNDVETNLDKLVSISETNTIYLKEMSEGVRRLEMAVNTLSSKLLNGQSKV